VGQILPFPIDFDGRPYNTLTLPCERVITAGKFSNLLRRNRRRKKTATRRLISRIILDSVVITASSRRRRGSSLEPLAVAVSPSGWLLTHYGWLGHRTVIDYPRGQTLLSVSVTEVIICVIFLLT